MSEIKTNFLSKLDETDGRYEEIEKQIADPEISSDVKRLIPLATTAVTSWFLLRLLNTNTLLRSVAKGTIFTNAKGAK